MSLNAILKTEFPCDANAVLDGDKRNFNPWGVITKLKVGDHEIKSDWKVHLPSTGKEETVVSVLSMFEWDFCKDNPMTFIGVVHDDVAKAITAAAGELKNMGVHVTFEVQDHNGKPDASGHYFVARKGTVEGQFVLSAGAAEISVTPLPRDTNRKRFAMRIQPANKQNDITVSDYDTQNYTKNFGPK